MVANPATIQKAIEKGELITEPPTLSAEDAINKRRQHALSLFALFEKTSRFTLRTHNEGPGKIDRLG